VAAGTLPSKPPHSSSPPPKVSFVTTTRTHGPCSAFYQLTVFCFLQRRACSTIGRPPWPSPPSWQQPTACSRKRH
jgi:hypothetical protein